MEVHYHGHGFPLPLFASLLFAKSKLILALVSLLLPQSKLPSAPCSLLCLLVSPLFLSACLLSPHVCLLFAKNKLV